MRLRHLAAASAVAATFLVLALALLRPEIVSAPPSAPVRRVMLALPAALSGYVLVVARHLPLDRSPWWRLLRAGFLLVVLGQALRDAPLLPPGTTREVAVGLASALGNLCLVGAVVAWERAQGRTGVLDHALDLVTAAVSLLAAAFVLRVRPAHDAGTGTGRLAVESAAMFCGLLVAAAVLAAIASGALRHRAGVWAGLAAGIYVWGVVIDFPEPLGGSPSLGAHLAWMLSGVYFLVAVQAFVELSEHTDQWARGARWQPLSTALACALPLGIYCWQALRSRSPGDGQVPDARVLGGALVLLCLCCMLRVQRAVGQAEGLRGRLESMARSDHLTGLANRRTGAAELERVMARARAGDETLAVALCDLDHFKAFNDRYGHHAGDELLVGAAQAWASCLGSGQLLARHGGEEFLVISTGLPPSALAEIVDRMRTLTPRGQSFSAGVAGWDGQEDGDALVARADAALYDAKATGRARTCIAYASDVLGVP